MDEKQVSDFLFEMSVKTRDTTRSIIRKDKFFEGVSAGINVAATTVARKLYEKCSVEECVNSALSAVALADIITSVFEGASSND